MNTSNAACLLGLALALAAIGPAAAQQPSPETKVASTPAASAPLNALKGSWIRPDGGYTIDIKGVSPNGQLEAMYFNPGALPFAKAQASQTGTALRVYFELRAGGYNGSTYELTYDPASDRLIGVYYQAVAKQKYDVFFTRK